LIGDQFAFLFGLVEILEVGSKCAHAGRGQGIAGRAREEVHSRILLTLALKNDLLRVGEDYVEARTIERV
jgi:hypothetical protein